MAIPSIPLVSSFVIQIERSQRGYFLPQYVIVNCCRITQYFKDHREDTHRLRPLQFVVTKAAHGSIFYATHRKVESGFLSRNSTDVNT